MDFTFDRLLKLSSMSNERYMDEIDYLLTIIRGASESELVQIEDNLTGYMARGKSLLNDALWERKTAIKQEKRLRKTSFWSLFGKKQAKFPTMTKQEDYIDTNLCSETLIDISYNRLYDLSRLSMEDYAVEINSLLSMIGEASESDLLIIEKFLMGYLQRGKSLLNDALWKRRTAIRIEQKERKSNFWTFFSNKAVKFVSKNQYTKISTNHSETVSKRAKKNDFHQLPDTQDQNSLFQDPDTQLQFQISS